MVEKIGICITGERLSFCNFQNASPHKSSGHFPRNSTQLYNSRLLQTGRVWASVLVPTPLAMTCEHGRKIEFVHNYGICRFFAIFKMHLRVSALTIFRETLLSYTTRAYYKVVEYQLLYLFLYHLPSPVNMVEKSKSRRKFDFSTMFTGHGKWCKNEYRSSYSVSW